MSSGIPGIPRLMSFPSHQSKTFKTVWIADKLMFMVNASFISGHQLRH